MSVIIRTIGSVLRITEEELFNNLAVGQYSYFPYQVKKLRSNNPYIKYVHEEDAHNLRSPSIIVPYLVDKFKPTSVIDVGCGIGTFLHVFKQQGVKEVLGIDGKWVNRKQLYIPEEEFLEVNLEEPIKLDKTYDLVLCLEVAEHLAPTAADLLVDSLGSLGKKIV